MAQIGIADKETLNSVKQDTTEILSQFPLDINTLNNKVFLKNGTFTVPEGVNGVYVTACGGGGGAISNRNSTRGGGGGDAIINMFFPVVSGIKFPITVGKGGKTRIVSGSIEYAYSGGATIIGNLATLNGGGGGGAWDPGLAGGPGGGDGGNGSRGLPGISAEGGRCKASSGGGGGGGSFGGGGASGESTTSETILGGAPIYERPVNGGFGGSSVGSIPGNGKFGGGGGGSTNGNTQGGDGGDGVVIIQW